MCKSRNLAPCPWLCLSEDARRAGLHHGKDFITAQQKALGYFNKQNCLVIILYRLCPEQESVKEARESRELVPVLVYHVYIRLLYYLGKLYRLSVQQKLIIK